MNFRNTFFQILSIIFEYSVYCIFFIIPFSKYRINIPTFFFFLSGILLLFFKENIREDLTTALKKNLYLIWPFFFSILFALFRPNNIDAAFILLNLPFFLIPLLISINKDILPKNIFEKIIIVASISMAIFMFIRIEIGLGYYFEHLSTDKLFYVQLLKGTSSHPTFLSIIVNYLFFCSVYLLSKLNKSDKLKISLLSINIVLLIVFLILLSSRIGLLFFILFSFISTMIYAYKKSKVVIYFFSFCIIFTSVIYISYNHLPRVVKRFEKLSSKKMGKFESRQFIWSASLDLIKKEPFLGYSNPILLKKKMVKEFENMGYSKGVFQAFNSHNQFLEFFLLYGVLGFLSFIISIIAAFKFIKKYQQYNFLILISLLLVYSITETILESQNGIVFFVLMLSLALNFKTFKLSLS